jgi:hypothetical protein
MTLLIFGSTKMNGLLMAMMVFVVIPQGIALRVERT